MARASLTLLAGLVLFLNWLAAGWSEVHAAPSTPAVLTSAASGEVVNGQVDYLIDSGGQLQIEDIIDNRGFRPTNGKAALGVLPSPLWLRLSLSRTIDAPGEWWLELSPMAAAEVRFFIPNQEGELVPVVAGDDFLFSNRPFPYRQYLVPIKVPYGQKVTIYIRQISHNGTIFPLRVWQFNDWAAQTLLEYLLLGGCFGVTIGLALYHLFLYVRLRDPLFMLYFALITSYTLFAADLVGLASHVMWPDQGWLGAGRNQALIALYGIFICLFTLRLLEEPSGSPWLARIMRGAALLYGVGLVIALAGQPFLAGLISNLSPLVTIPTALIAASRRAAKGFLPAVYYLFGYGAVLIGITLLLLRGNGVVAVDPVTALAFIVAGAWEAILFSQALAERVNILKQQREEAQAKVLEEKSARLDEARRNRDELESRVTERTRELAAEVEQHLQTAEQLRASQEQLVHLAYFDALTGLPNRRLFQDRFDQAVAKARRAGENFALMLIDLDKFKSINDRLGHDAGDALLVEAGKRMSAALRDTDSLARLGGDEFAIILGGPLDNDAVETVGRRLIEAFVTDIEFNGNHMHTSPSIGIAWFPQDGGDLTEIYKAADLALYGAKQAGRNCYRFYHKLVLA